jgi:hypothetical protein
MAEIARDLFEFAQKRRDRGMGLAADAEDRDQPKFFDAASRAIERVARRQRTVHVDDVLQECMLRPRHHNAWGGVWRSAIKRGVISRSSETRPCKTDPKKNAHNYPVYRSNLFGVPKDFEKESIA